METQLKTWQARVRSIREVEAKKERIQAEQAKELAEDLPPFVQKQFDQNIRLGKMLEDVTAEEAKIAETLANKKRQLGLLEEDFSLIHEQVKYPVHTEAIGLALLEQRQTLPSILNYRRESTRPGTLKNLQVHQLPNADNDHILLRTESSSKEERRDRVAEEHEILLLVGDNLADFSDAYDKKTVAGRSSAAEEMKEAFGSSYIILPNPQYGDWESALLNYDYSIDAVSLENVSFMSSTT